MLQNLPFANSRPLRSNIHENVTTSYMQSGRSNDVFVSLKDGLNGGLVGVIVFKILASFVRLFVTKLNKVRQIP